MLKIGVSKVQGFRNCELSPMYRFLWDAFEETCFFLDLKITNVVCFTFHTYPAIYVSPLKVSGDMLFSPLRPSICPSQNSVHSIT